MYGCPYGCIYKSADIVQEMRTGKNFQYQGDVIVTMVRENGGKVSITGFNHYARPAFIRGGPGLPGCGRDSDRANHFTVTIRL